MAKWSKMSRADKGWSVLGYGFIGSVIVATICDIIWPSEEVKDRRAQEKERKRLTGKILKAR